LQQTKERDTFLNMKKKWGLILSLLVSLILILTPFSVKIVIERTIVKSLAEVDSGGVSSKRVSVENNLPQEKQPFYIKYLPEIGGVFVFLWLTSIVFWLGYRERKEK